MISTIIKRKWIFVGLIITVLGVMLTSLFLSREEELEFSEVSSSTNSYRKLEVNDQEYKYNSSIVSILFLGVDRKDTANNQGQADVINFVLLNRNLKQVQLLTIPRDLMTDIRLFDVAGRDLGWNVQHLSLAYSYGKTPDNGSMYTLQAVSRLFNNVPLTRYLTFDLSSLQAIHNIVGGTLQVTVPNNSLSHINSNWTQGKTVEINNDNIEAYVRIRDVDTNFSNTSRMEIQKSYLMAYYQKLQILLQEDFKSTMALMYETFKLAHTNMSYNDIEVFAKMLMEYTFDSSQSFYMLQGENIVGEYHDEVHINQEEIQDLLVKLFYTKEG